MRRSGYQDGAQLAGGTILALIGLVAHAPLLWALGVVAIIHVADL